MKLNKLAGKMITWFNETNRGVDRDFKYRFTGQESNAFLKYFPVLFSKFIMLVDDARAKKRFLQYFYQLLSHQEIDLLHSEAYKFQSYSFRGNVILW